MNIKLWKLIHTETDNNTYYLPPSSHKHEQLYKLKRDFVVLGLAIKLPWNKKRNIRVHDGEKKSKWQMLFESLVWFFRYRELCDNYFAYGLDIKGTNPNDYLGYKEFRMIRNIVNIRLRENLQTNYIFNYLALTRDKFVFYQWCESLGMPHPKTIALLRGGEVAWYKKMDLEFEPLESVLLHNMDAFCKEVTGELGAGAFSMSVGGGKISILNKKCTLEDLRTRIKGKNYIIQERIENHHLIKEIYPSALNTVRLVTAMRQDGMVEFYGAQLRFGTGGAVVDNAGQGGFFVGISEDGVLQDVGYFEPMKRDYILVKNTHPDTGKRFAGLSVPHWNDAKEAALKFHKFMYGLPCLGWDIAITEEGFVFTEAGEDWEIQMNQCPDGGQREHFYRLFGYALKEPLRKF